MKNFSQNTHTIKWLELSDEGSTSVNDSLEAGGYMPDISWAWKSTVACFPQTQSKKFSGHHVLYGLILPAFTEIEIMVIPNNPEDNYSLYAYMVGTVSEDNTVPFLSSCIRCEADHKWDYKKRGQVQDHKRKIKDILALANPYQVIIGVVGAEGLSKGNFELIVSKLNSANPKK